MRYFVPFGVTSQDASLLYREAARSRCSPTAEFSGQDPIFPFCSEKGMRQLKRKVLKPRPALRRWYICTRRLCSSLTTIYSLLSIFYPPGVANIYVRLLGLSSAATLQRNSLAFSAVRPDCPSSQPCDYCTTATATATAACCCRSAARHIGSDHPAIVHDSVTSDSGEKGGEGCKVRECKGWMASTDSGRVRV